MSLAEVIERRWMTRALQADRSASCPELCLLIFVWSIRICTCSSACSLPLALLSPRVSVYRTSRMAVSHTELQKRSKEVRCRVVNNRRCSCTVGEKQGIMRFMATSRQRQKGNKESFIVLVLHILLSRWSKQAEITLGGRRRVYGFRSMHRSVHAASSSGA